MSAPVFVVEAGTLDGVRVGGEATLTGAEARHAAQVQRLRLGEVIDVVDGAGTRVSGPIRSASPREVVVAVERVVVEPAPTPRLTLVQALAKGRRDELAIETATELGVDAVRPWQSERSVVQWRGDKVGNGELRWGSVVLSAAKVARRARVPQVLAFAHGGALLASLEVAVADGAALLVLHEGATTPLVDLTLTGMEEVIVVVGPEGGLSDSEVAALVGIGGTAVLLGPHVLRASTAGPAALAAISTRVGRWS